jgi:hypothetical protein
MDCNLCYLQALGWTVGLGLGSSCPSCLGRQEFRQFTKHTIKVSIRLPASQIFYIWFLLKAPFSELHFSMNMPCRIFFYIMYQFYQKEAGSYLAKVTAAQRIFFVYFIAVQNRQTDQIFTYAVL